MVLCSLLGESLLVGPILVLVTVLLVIELHVLHLRVLTSAATTPALLLLGFHHFHVPSTQLKQRIIAFHLMLESFLAILYQRHILLLLPCIQRRDALLHLGNSRVRKLLGLGILQLAAHLHGALKTSCLTVLDHTDIFLLFGRVSLRGLNHSVSSRDDILLLGRFFLSASSASASASAASASSFAVVFQERTDFDEVDVTLRPAKFTLAVFILSPEIVGDELVFLSPEIFQG